MYSFAHNMDETTISTSRGLRSILPQPVLEDPHDPSYSYVFQDATCRMCEEDEQYDDDVNYIFGDPGAGGSGEEDDEESAWFLDETNASLLATEQTDSILFPSRSKKSEWLWRMNRRLQETPEGTLDPATLPVTAVMNALAKTKSVHGASLVEQWLKRIEKENSLGNNAVDLTTKMYTMAGKFCAILTIQFGRAHCVLASLKFTLIDRCCWCLYCIVALATNHFPPE